MVSPTNMSARPPKGVIRAARDGIRTLVCRQTHETIVFGFIALLWAALVLPSAFINGLFMLDMGGVFDAAANFPNNLEWMLSPYTGTGRFFPLYWLYHALVSVVFGFDIRGHYLILAILFLAGTVLTAVLFLRIVRHLGFALALAAALFISTPNVEALYAFGKAEPLLYTILSAILLIFYVASSRSGALPITSCAVITALYVCALWLKETAILVVVLPTAAIGLIGLFRGRAEPFSVVRSKVWPYARLLACFVVGYAISKLPFVIFTSTARTSRLAYTTYSLTGEIIFDNFLFYVTQQPDVTLLGIIGSVLMLTHLRRAVGDGDGVLAVDFIFAASLLLTAWAYVSVFLLWRWSMAYYLYVPAIIFRFVAAYAIFLAWKAGMAKSRRFRVGLATALALIFLHTGAYLWYAGSSQVLLSKAYTDALQQYVRMAPHDGALVFESYPYYSEQVRNTQQLLNVVYHADRRLHGIGDVLDPAVVTPQVRELLGITDADLAANAKRPPRKGDYVIAVVGDELATWQVRGVGPFYSEGSTLRRNGAYELEEVASRRIYFPSLFINVWNLRPDARQAYVGYELYRVIDGPRFTWFGRYPDGWIGKEARLTLYPQHVSTALLHVSTPRVLAANEVKLFQDERLIETVSLSADQEHTFRLAPGPAPTEFRVEVARTFVPNDLRITRDNRRLGVLTRLEPFRADAP